MNLKEIRELINLMNEHELSEIEVEREGAKIKIVKSSSGNSLSTERPAPQYHIDTSAPPQDPIDSPRESISTCKEIRSPMVGTFYRAPSPEAPPFVDVGQDVEVGQVVCIVEAMKLMNEIKSEVKGKIVEIPVENAQPVEFDQSLFIVEPV